MNQLSRSIIHPIRFSPFFTALYIGLLLLMPSVMVAQVAIHGKVVDADNMPIEYATVRVKGTPLGTTTNSSGDYRITVARQDTLVVMFTCIGFREVRRTIIEPQGADVTLNVRMLSDEKELDAVEVSEIKKQTGSLAALDSHSWRLAADPTGGSVEAMIATMPGVYGSNELSTQYSVRGGSYDENSVYINGIEVYRPLLVTSGQQEGLSVINPDMVDAISFSSGGFPAEYDDKMSSVLAITYRRPQAFEGSVSASLMGASLALGQSSSKFSQLHGVRYKRNSSLLSSTETKGEYDPRYFDYQTHLTFEPSKKVTMSVLGNISLNDYRFKPTDRTTSFGTAEDAKQFKVYFDGQEKDKFETWFGAFTLDYHPRPNTRFTLLGSGFLTNELVAYDISGEYWLDQAGTGGDEGIGGELGVGRYQEHARNRLKATVWNVALRGETKVGINWLSYGLGIERRVITERSREWEMRDSAGYSLPYDPGALKVYYNLNSNNELRSTRINFFLQDNLRINSDKGFWNILLGLRVSNQSFNKETLVSPRFSIGFVPSANPRWALRLAGGLYYQSPFYKETRLLYEDALGNTQARINYDIKSPRSFHIIAGTDYTFRAFSRPFKISGELYYKGMSRIIPYEIDNLKIVYTGQNESSGYVAGLDMKLFGQFVPGSDSWVSLSLMKSEEKLRGKKVPMANDHRYALTFFFTDYWPGHENLKLSLRAVLNDGLPLTPPQSTRDQSYFRAPAYKRIDLGISYGLVTPLKEGEPRTGIHRTLRSVWLGLDVFNLLDISNVSNYYWVTDVNNLQYAVPNYLTRRQLNIKLTIDF
ncbi:MAG: TonB-dependent receptor [Bacteroidales bacterium]|nr:TonB-dependent receptor [Bacteroidales bacterium]